MNTKQRHGPSFPAFLGECRIASARHTFTKAHTYMPFQWEGIWEIRQKCVCVGGGSNNHHYSFLPFLPTLILHHLLSYSTTKWFQSLSSLKTLTGHRDAVAQSVFVFVSHTTEYQGKLSSRWKTVEHTVTLYVSLSAVQIMKSQISFPLCLPQ